MSYLFCTCYKNIKILNELSLYYIGSPQSKLTRLIKQVLRFISDLKF